MPPPSHSCRCLPRAPADDSGTNYCQLHRSLGGWGPPTSDPWRVVNLPNNGVLIANNIFLNPVGTRVGTPAEA